MCGIAAEIQFGSTCVDEFRHLRQLEKLKHRGPDTSGYFKTDKIILGQTRLRVVDVQGGDPPIQTANAEVSVTFNGEIYNFRELRSELQSQGLRFTTMGDTEVIANLFLVYPPMIALNKLDGMFALAVWHSGRGELIVARDRFGEKPLYWTKTSSAAYFASEIKAFLPVSEISLSPMTEKIPEYLSFGYIPEPDTFFKDVFAIMPGTYLTCTPTGETVSTRYWQIQHEQCETTSLNASSRELRTLIDGVVSSRAYADVSLGLFLSGGVDSSIVVASLATQTSKTLETFTIGFDDNQGFDERPYARQVSDIFHTNHHELVVKPDLIQTIWDLVDAYDQPFGDSSALPTYFLSKMTKGSCTVALSGDGGDEMFGGYPRFQGGIALDLLERHKYLNSGATLLQSLTQRVPNATVKQFSNVLDSRKLSLVEAYRTWISFSSDAEIESLTGRTPKARDFYEKIWEELGSTTSLQKMLLLNLTTYLSNDLLTKVDRVAMQHSLEVRSPFLSHKVAEFAFSLPNSYRTTLFDTKIVLKKAYEDLLPKSILHRKKRGFGIPLDRWFREDLTDFTKDLLGEDSLVRAQLNGSALDLLIYEHFQSIKNHGMTLWSLITLELFLRKWTI